MDDYYYIQKTFSDLYFSKVKPYIEEYNKKRKKERGILFLCLLGVVLFCFLAICFAILFYNVAVVVYDEYGKQMFIFGCWFTGLVLFIVFACLYAFCWEGRDLGSELHLGNPDKDFKTLVFCNIALKPYLDLKWCKPRLEYGRAVFFDMVNAHKILKINSKAFKSDDVFEGTFHSIKYEIYEIVNRFGGHIFEKIGLEKFIVIFFIFLFGIVMATMLYNGFSTEYKINETVMYISWILLAVVFIILVIKKLLFTDNGWFARKYSNMGFLDKFKGLIVRFKTKKEIEGHTVILENYEENLFLKFFTNNHYEKVELEDVEFNKRFTVYSTNQVEARYALTSAMMERLLNLKQNFKSKYIRASFLKDELVFAIQSDADLFKLGALLEDTDSKMYQTMFLEIISILKITDALNLQSDTGL